MTTERHLRWSLLAAGAFAMTGMIVEAIYAFRVSGFIDDPVRREFLRLGHIHGALLLLANVALAWSTERLATPRSIAGPVRGAGFAGGILVGLGFLGGGVWHGPNDPGVLVLLVPAGGLMFLSAAWTVGMTRRASAAPPPHDP